ncbi:iron complex transport system substrate-binding protein [Roseovarius pacificus]|uniref:Iron complex transport system substrate-binding protein n=2 Tax=Roseovarius pacificus TaxID=337701 RepID=A0A1M7A992_9RHOB|nr:iron complex transport system substrate-binding protein [Roseovarius pacificus]
MVRRAARCISAFRRASEILRSGPHHAAALTALLSWASPAASGDAAPMRVASMNLCTDQLAMLIAQQGQLHSVSYLASDPRSSAMADKAAGYVENHGLAEEIYLMQPDLVIAGQYSTQATTAMLRRLGIPVEVFPPATSLEDVRARILRMGDILHRQVQARELVAEFDARLGHLRQQVTQRPEAVLYYANGYTSGDSTLAGQILLAAGFENATTRAGYGAGARLPLEVLVMTIPDIVITSRPYPGASRSEAMLDHPAVRAFRTGRAGATMTDHDWVCGTPYVLRAIEELAETRRAITGETR